MYKEASNLEVEYLKHFSAFETLSLKEILNEIHIVHFPAPPRCFIKAKKNT